MIYYQANAVLTPIQLNTLYSSVGWSTYTSDLDKLARAVANSLIVITAWQNTTLVGLTRAVGDGETILYVQDILVTPNHQHKGIGTQLLTQLLDTYPDVRQKMLLTDDTPNTRQFYDGFGLNPSDSGTISIFSN